VEANFEGMVKMIFMYKKQGWIEEGVQVSAPSLAHHDIGM
jgi:hypothetical protein